MNMGIEDASVVIRDVHGENWLDDIGSLEGFRICV